MSQHELQQQLDVLRKQLESSNPLSSVEQEQLQALIAQIELQLGLDVVAPESSLRDSLEQVVEGFELEHPTLAATLRGIMQTLANMGI